MGLPLSPQMGRLSRPAPTHPYADPVSFRRHAAQLCAALQPLHAVALDQLFGTCAGCSLAPGISWTSRWLGSTVLREARLPCTKCWPSRSGRGASIAPVLEGLQRFHGPDHALRSEVVMPAGCMRKACSAALQDNLERRYDCIGRLPSGALA